MQTPFDPAELEQFKKPGSASLIGQAFLRQNGGGIVTCAGAPVVLMLDSLYVLEARLALAKGEAITPEVSQHLYSSILHRTTCDARGNFAFTGIVPGHYAVSTEVAWTVGNEPQGGEIEKDIIVSPGENNVILTR